MNFCSKCGSKASKLDRFCPKCGMKLEEKREIDNPDTSTLDWGNLRWKNLRDRYPKMNHNEKTKFKLAVLFFAICTPFAVLQIFNIAGIQIAPSNSGQSEAFQLGYSQVAELGAEKRKDKFFAYAYCTTMAQNIFTTDSQQEFDEYVAGCMDYVMSE